MPLSSLARLAPAALVVALAAGCPDSTAQTCPDKTIPAGTFNLTLTLQPSASQCVVLDGGVPVHLVDGGSQFGNVAPLVGTLCSGNPDGGPEQFLWLAILNQVDRKSPLKPTGGFTFDTTTNQNVTQTPCGCSIDYTETISGILVSSGDASVQIVPDAGLSPPVAAIDASVVDALDASVGATGCTCALPCDLHYQMTGTPAQ